MSIIGVAVGIASGATTLSEEEKPSGIDMFLPGLPEIIWSLVVVVLLAFVFYKFVLPKMGDVFAGRAEKIEGEIVAAAKQKAEAEALHTQYTTEIKSAKIEASEIKDAARAEGNQIISDARVKATSDAELIVKNAKRAVDSERKAAEAQLKKQVGSLAMAMTQKMLLSGVENDQRQSKLIDNSLDRFENSLSSKSNGEAIQKSSRKPRTSSREPRTSSREPRTSSREPRTSSRARRKVTE